MNRQELFRQLIQRNSYQSYLEIGCETDKTFGRLDLPRKVGVDPQRGGTHRMTSDEFFAQAQTGETFDLVFVDGLHRWAGGGIVKCCGRGCESDGDLGEDLAVLEFGVFGDFDE